MVEHAESSPSPRMTGKGYTMPEVRQGLFIVLYSWILGSIFVALTSGVVFTAFLTKFLHVDDYSFGVITSIGTALVVMQVFGAYIAERTGRAKRHFIIFFAIYRFLWVAIAAVPLFMMHLPLSVRLFFIGGVIASGTAIAYFSNAGWSAWIADIVPKSISGKFFGTRSRLGLIAMVAASYAVALLLDRYEQSRWLYASIFIVAGVLGAAEILLYHFVKEVPRKVEETLPSFNELLLTPWKNAAFRRYALYTCVTWIAYMLMGNYQARYCLLPVSEHGMGMSASFTNFSLSIVLILTMALVAPFWGSAVDRLGPKPVLATSSAAQIIFPIFWVFVQPNFAWLVPVYAVIVGLSWPGVDQAILYMQMKGFPETRRTTYIAAFGIVFGLACTVGNFLGGILASFFQANMMFFTWLPGSVNHYQLLFLTAIVLRLFAFVFILPRMPMPGKTAGHRAVAQTVATHATASLPRVLRRRSIK